ncbi:hypothetical protein ETB97_001971 [Aspergillus alliaceus]|uniref:O-methyltransferase C-terminal domain-containing protein n=1 Tax=Petromyces alliaceus TaxID=209559 RepID=A0A8H6AGP2_PETAA|nr:hypothetical protein ETB97_001971 [Aspergillus burnettii]
MDSPHNLSDLASEVSLHAQILERALKKQSPCEILQDPRGPKLYPRCPASETIQHSRAALINASMELYRLALGPEDWLKMSVTYVICHFQIASAVPIPGEISYHELSCKVDLPITRLQLVLGYAITTGVFRETRPGYITHTPVSMILARDPELASWVEHNCDEAFPAAAKLLGLLQDNPKASDPSQSAFSAAFDNRGGLFDLYAQEPWRGARFSRAMKGVTRGTLDAEHLVIGHDWALLRNGGVVVDVGGSLGHQSVAIAKHFSHLKFIVQDVDDFSEPCQHLANDQGVGSQIEFQQVSFFDANPVLGAEVYLVRHVCHDWPDQYVVKILRNLMRAASPTSEILIVDSVVPPRVDERCFMERYLRSISLQMNVLFNALERTAEQWASVVQQADPRWSIYCITTPPGSMSSIIDIRLTEKRSCNASGTKERS